MCVLEQNYFKTLYGISFFFFEILLLKLRSEHTLTCITDCSDPFDAPDLMQIHDDIMCTGNTVSRPGSV